ncbi:MAG: glycosyltransferase, partial [Planctomycetota bacterium]
QHYADHYPETRSKLAFRYWLRALSRSLSTFDRVLTVSKSAADQLRSFCDRHKIQTPAIEVTYEGSTWEHYRSLRFQKQDRVIHLASTAIHKRTNELIKHWCQLRSRREALPELILVGSIDDEARVLIDGNPGIRKMPRATQEQLRDLVGSCRALLLPSEIEGFGLPAIEAYYVGTPACYVGDTSVDEILNMDREVVLPGRFELGDLGSFESALEQAISLSDSEIRHVSNALFDRFATAKIAERVMHAFRRSIV